MPIAEAPAVCSRTAPTGPHVQAPQPPAPGPRPPAARVVADPATPCTEAEGA
jgi:hypothetical protein